MIESRILEWIDLGDSVQTLEIYSKKKLLRFFNWFRIINKYKPDNVLFIFFCKFFYYFQFLIISLINTPEERKNSDSLIKVINYIKKIIFVQDIIKNKKSYIIVLSFSFIFCIIFFYHIICLLFISNKNIRKFQMISLNYLNYIFQNILLCLLINTFMLTIKCQNKQHIYLDIQCWKSKKHIVLTIISLLFLLILLFYSILLSIYNIQVGSIKLNHSNHSLTCVNNNYIFLSNILSIICYFIGFFVQYYTDDKKIYRIFNRFIVFIISLVLLVFVYKYVFYYNSFLNYTILFGWSFVLWYTIGMIFKYFLDLKDTLLFVLIGWVILILIIKTLTKNRIEYFLTEANVLEAKTIKEVEMFTFNLLLIASNNDIQSKTLLIGLTKSLKDFFSNNNELYEKFNKFENNKMLIQKLGGPNSPIFEVYNIIYLIYDYYINRTLLKDDILILFCYFLTNKLRNASYAFYLCTKIKVSSHKLSYLKFVLMEDLKDYLMAKLSKNTNNKETIKYVQLGSVISYNCLIDSFKLKIYDATSNQIDYFDILRNSTLSSKITNNFLRLGETIIQLRSDILRLWDKIIQLNPFSDENEKDYMLYLQSIIQDEELAKKEEKRYNQIKLSKLSKKNNIYHTLFLKDISSILLLNGSIENCKIIYSTSNFPIMFNFQPKEVLSMSVEDLIPECLSFFHNELINNVLKYSNVSYVFNRKFKNTFIKSKGNGLFNSDLYVKCLPDLSHGIIFIAAVQKLNDNKFLILLDSDFKINAMSDPLSITNGNNISSLIGENLFGLNQKIFNHHIAILIPEILKQIKFENQKFCLCNNDIDLKGVLYPNSNDFSKTENDIEIILDRIRQSGQLLTEEYLNSFHHRETPLRRTTTKTMKKESNLKEYNELIESLDNKFFGKTYSIFYNIIMKSFLNEKFIYYRLYITNDVLGNNNNEINYSNFQRNCISPKVDIVKNKARVVSQESNVFKSSDKLDNKERVIKLKINDNEIKPLIDKFNTNNFNAEIKDSKENKNEIIQEKISQNSFSTNASIDSAIFNKLKSKILEKNNPIYIKYMKIMTIIYIILTVIFAVYYNASMKSRFKQTYKFINQNYFFNTSKVFVSCAYLSGINLKFIKHGILNENSCYSANCSQIYIKIFTNCLNTIKNSSNELVYFDVEYKNIIFVPKDYKIYVYTLNYTQMITMNTHNLLNYILSNGLRVIANIESYFENKENLTLDVYEENLLNCSFHYIHDNDIKDFRTQIKKNKLNQKRFNPDYIYYVLNLIFYVIICGVFVYFIFKIYSIEKYFILKLIWYSTPNFNNYLKYLTELKNKLRNEPDEEDEDKFDFLKNESNNNNLQSVSENNQKLKPENKKESSQLTIKKDTSKGKKKKKMQGRLSKAQQEKKEKIHMMNNSFLIYNILIGIRLLLILVILIIYYILIDLIYKKRKQDFIEWDNVMSEVYGIFNESSLKFSIIKNQTSNYLNYEINKKKYIKQLQEGKIDNITINSITYSKNNINELNSTSYKLIVPSIEEISIPKVGNNLIPFFSKNENGLGNSPYSKLYKLYYGDLCELLYEDDIVIYNNCNNFWSSVLKQGLEQTLTQFSIEINTLLGELKDINDGILTLKDINDFNGTLGKIEVFINYFFLDSFTKTRELFKLIMEDKINDLNSLLNRLFAVVIFLIPIIFILVLIFITFLNNNFTSFLNFIGIFPIQYLSEDKVFYSDTLKLEGHIFES